MKSSESLMTKQISSHAESMASDKLGDSSSAKERTSKHQTAVNNWFLASGFAAAAAHMNHPSHQNFF